MNYAGVQCLPLLLSKQSMEKVAIRADDFKGENHERAKQCPRLADGACLMAEVEDNVATIQCDSATYCRQIGIQCRDHATNNCALHRKNALMDETKVKIAVTPR